MWIYLGLAFKLTVSEQNLNLIHMARNCHPDLTLWSTLHAVVEVCLCGDVCKDLLAAGCSEFLLLMATVGSFFLLIYSQESCHLVFLPCSV